MKTRLIFLFALTLILAACENQKNEFDDFGSTGVYFPFQTPARSLILGKYDLGFNDNDNNKRFEITVTMGGVYTNDIERKVSFVKAPELLDDVDNVVALPDNYYNIVTESPVTIPVGSTKGRITIQLTDAFFQDPLSFARVRDSVNYVVPLLITDVENLDFILAGEAAVDNPSRVNETHWSIFPKDFTLFGIKYINKYHAYYLRRGVDVVTDAAGQSIDNVYSNEFIERDELVLATISGENNIELLNRVRRGNNTSPGDVNLELSFDDNNNCIIGSYDSDPYNVTGTGKFVTDGDTWGGKPRDVIYLDYTYIDVLNNETHAVKDTLVVRDRNVVFEEFSIRLK
ncbi:DUF5627 domain-containing protein [Polaribacter sp.]|uniref:DUF5627 domain-containing protein n=1 Tax=Polaribacter sp. TaxID=1920175 RepID=UPI0025EB7E0C|nr:DUF5627 domain-containing protein [Polaribacter sp.]